jgi:hypothetical protein
MTEDVFVSEPVAHVLRLYDGLVDERAWERTAREQVGLLAARLLDGHRARHPGAAVELHNWLPRTGAVLTGEPFDRALTRDDALETVSRGHGFAGWAAAQTDGLRGADPEFERAVEDVLRGDVAALGSTLDRTPDLVRRRSHYGHRATLLHYLAANGVETYRQRVPLGASELAALMIERGADPLATATMYGGGRTTRAMLISSSHPAQAGVTGAVLAVLDRAGGTS